MRVNLIAGIGLEGQIGLNNTLPWKNAPAETTLGMVAKADMDLFRKLTLHKHIIMGSTTAAAVGKLPDRRVHIYRRKWTPQEFLISIENNHNPKEVWVCGGAKVYELFAPYINGVRVLSVIPYEGEADSFFPEAGFTTWPDDPLKKS